MKVPLTLLSLRYSSETAEICFVHMLEAQHCVNYIKSLCVLGFRLLSFINKILFFPIKNYKKNHHLSTGTAVSRVANNYEPRMGQVLVEIRENDCWCL